MKSKSSELLAAATAAALLCAGTVSRAQEEPKPPATHTEPAPAKARAAAVKSTTSPAPAIKPAASTAKAPAATRAKPTTAAATSTPAKAPATAASAQPANSSGPSQPVAAANGQPGKIRICDPDNAGWCWTYTRNGDHYDGVGEHGGNRTLTLETFTTGSVVLRVTQAGKPGWSSTNSGRMTGNGIELGEWSDNAGHKGRITASWDAVPQSPSAGAKPAAAFPSPARPGASAHTNVETTGGLEQRAAAHSKPAAATATPAEVPK